MGFGFRYDTPLGPLRIDYGFKLDRRTRYSVTCPDITSPCAESARPVALQPRTCVLT